MAFLASAVVVALTVPEAGLPAGRAAESAEAFVYAGNFTPNEPSHRST